MADRTKQEELIVITKTYDLNLWSCNHASKFPRNHRFVLGEKIERTLDDLLEILIRAKYARQRQPLLEQANLTLEILRFQIRLAKDLQCLKVESYGFAAKAIDDIGNRNNNQPTNRNNNIGFRLASTLPCLNSPGQTCGAC